MVGLLIQGFASKRRLFAILFFFQSDVLDLKLKWVDSVGLDAA